MQRWRKWKHIGEDDDDEDPDWMKSEGAGYAIGRRIFDKSEIEVSSNCFNITYQKKIERLFLQGV